MKTIFRILVILVVASIIGGLMYAAVSAAGNNTQTRTRDDLPGDRPAPPDGEFRPERDGDREGFEGGFMLPFGMVKSLVLMCIIGVPYFFWRRRNQLAR